MRNVVAVMPTLVALVVTLLLFLVLPVIAQAFTSF